VLRILVTGARTPVALRLLAVEESLRRGLVDSDLLKSVLVHDEMVESLFRLAAGPTPTLLPSILGSAIHALDASSSDFHDLADRAHALTSTVAELKSHLDGELTRLSAWTSLGWTRDSSLAEQARAVFDTDGQMIVQGVLNIPGWTPPPELVPFLRGKARVSALRILTAVTPSTPEDVARVRAELSRDDPLTRGEAVQLMAEVALPEDMDLLVAHLSKVYGRNRIAVVRRILSVGGAEGARRLLAHGSPTEQVLAVQRLGADSSVANDELRDLLYAPDTKVRLEAVDQLVRRSELADLTALLNDYPRARDTYYYNVIVELDWVIHGKRPPGLL